MDIRVGNGYDTHPLINGESLILGGVLVPHHKGIKGHSDGDVLTHAIIDSILGATALGDIGKFFPSKNMNLKGISSLTLLSEIISIIGKKSFYILNIDSTIILEAPKIEKYIDSIKSSLANILLIPKDKISVKATTNDRLGFIGEERGVSVISTVLIKKLND
tara:strand:- start:5963 stop:6448 length:486 start_codon:yes stop_codon:yes gene_type:complete